VAASQISRSISSSEKNHGLRFEGILKIQFARKSPSKGQKPANSITSAHPISQPAQGIQNSSRTTGHLANLRKYARITPTLSLNCVSSKPGAGQSLWLGCVTRKESWLLRQRRQHRLRGCGLLSNASKLGLIASRCVTGAELTMLTALTVFSTSVFN
jgi:hypothetical protein